MTLYADRSAAERLAHYLTVEDACEDGWTYRVVERGAYLAIIVHDETGEPVGYL